MSDMTRKVFKFAKAVTLAAGIVAVSAVVASGAAAGTVAAGLQKAKSVVLKKSEKDEAFVAELSEQE